MEHARRNEVFSSDNALELQPEEKKQYVKRLVECNVSIFDSIKATKDGHVCTLLDLLKTLIDEYSDISEFNETKMNIFHKARELKMHGYTI